MYILHISGDTVQILEGSFSRKKITVNSLYSVPMPSDYLDIPDDKGYEKLEAVVSNGLRELGENYQNKKIRIVVDNINIPFREMIVPTLNHKKTVELLRNEIFGDEKLAASNTLDYIEVEKKVDGNKQSRLFVTYMDNTILADLQRLCKNLMFKLVAIDIGQNCSAKLLRYTAEYLPSSYVFVEMRDSIVIISLVLEGKFKYTMTKSVVSLQTLRFKSERTYFVNEMTNALRTAVELFHKLYPDQEFNDIVVAGTTEKYDLIAKAVGEKIGMQVISLTVPPNMDSIGQEEYNDFFCTIGGLIRGEALK